MPCVIIQPLKDKNKILVPDGAPIETTVQWVSNKSEQSVTSVTMRLPVEEAAMLPLAGQMVDIREDGDTEVRRYEVGLQQQEFNGTYADVGLFLVV